MVNTRARKRGATRRKTTPDEKQVESQNTDCGNTEQGANLPKQDYRSNQPTTRNNNMHIY